MPKRSKEDELRRCFKKLKKIEERIQKFSDTEHVPVQQDDEIGEEEQDGGGTSKEEDTDQDQVLVEVENLTNPEVENQLVTDALPVPPGVSEQVSEDEILDPEVLLILGNPVEEKTKYGPKISPNLANRWGAVLLKGLDKEEKDKITKDYQVPSNCERLQAPVLNPEIASAISDMAKNRDKKLEVAQQQLGIGLSALGRAMTLVINEKPENMNIIKHLNDAGRILADLHFCETKARKFLITPVLDKSFIGLVRDIDHDELLYGSNLTEKIRALKNIERSGLSIKKVEEVKNKYIPQPRRPGNFNGPPRYQPRFTPAVRGTARGGFRRPQLPPRRPAATAAPATRKEFHATR